MKRTTTTTTFFITLLAFLWVVWPLAASAQEAEVIYQDVTTFGEPLMVEAHQTVYGSAVAFGSSAVINGTINGDVVVMGGNLEIGPTASISGDCVVMGGTVTGATNACQEIFSTVNLGMDWASMGLNMSQWLPSAAVPPAPAIVSPPMTPTCLELVDDVCLRYEAPSPPPPAPSNTYSNPRDNRHHRYDNSPSFFARLSGAAVWSLFVGGLAYGLMSVAPDHVQRVERTIRRKAVPSGVVGFLTSLAVPSAMFIIGLISLPLLLICGVGLLGAPILAVIGLGMLFASLLGWVALGSVVADKLSSRFGWQMGKSDRARAVTGTILLSLALNVLGAIPLVPESLLRWPLLWVGLGAVVLTQFGRRYYPHRPDGEDDEPEVDPHKMDIVLQTLPHDS